MTFYSTPVMPFGMCNAPATLQRLVNTVLAGVKNCNASLDDLIVYSETWESHMSSLSEVFSHLVQANITINLAKCEFGKASLTYLDRQVSQDEVCPVESKVEAIASSPIPTTRKALCSFLGLAGYDRAFCRNFSPVVEPLTRLLALKSTLFGTQNVKSNSIALSLSSATLLCWLPQTFPSPSSWRWVPVPWELVPCFCRKM